MKVALCFFPIEVVICPWTHTELGQIAALACPLQANPGTETTGNWKIVLRDQLLKITTMALIIKRKHLATHFKWVYSYSVNATLF